MNESQLANQLQQLHTTPPPVDWARDAIATGRRRRRRRTTGLVTAAVAAAGLSVGLTAALHHGSSVTLRDTDATTETAASAPFRLEAAGELRQIQRGDCGPTAAAFDPLVRSNLDAAQLCASFVDYTDQFGRVVASLPAHATMRGSLTVIQIGLRLEHARGEYRVTFHPDRTIAGIYFLRAGVPLP